MADKRFFTNKGPFTLEEICNSCDAKLLNETDTAIIIEDVASIENAQSTHLTFLSNMRYVEKLTDCKAKACIIKDELKDKLPPHIIAVIAKDPYVSYAKAAQKFYPTIINNEKSEISPAAIIEKTAIIGKNCIIKPGCYIGNQAIIGDNCTFEPNCVIGDNVVIGNNCHINSNASITHAIIGDNALIYSGARIGQDGFGFATYQGKHIKIPQLGRVIIGTDVEIGANSCIDRGAGPDTIIGDGCRIDNLVQIGHNVELGKGCVVVAHVGISGSTKCGNYVVFGGQSGVAGHLTIGDGVNIAAQSGVINNIAAGKVIGGSPAIDIMQWHRQTIAIKKLIKLRTKNDDDK